jgi:hypothetical protein
LIKYPASLALPKSHPHANKPEIPLSLLKEEPFIGLNRIATELRLLAFESLPKRGFQAANRQIQRSGRRIAPRVGLVVEAALY